MALLIWAVWDIDNQGAIAPQIPDMNPGQAIGRDFFIVFNNYRKIAYF